jgi:hypothetical protein
MQQNLAYARARLKARLNGSSGPATPVLVRWRHPVGDATPDPITGALPDGATQEVSGTLRGGWHPVTAATRLRQHAEIRVGDVLLDLDPDAGVTACEGQALVSGTLRLEDLTQRGARFEVDGQLYTQAELGEDLAQAWDVVVGGVHLLRTVLLRTAV